VSIVHTVSEAMRYIKAVGHSGVRHINADVYHMQSREAHTGEAIIAAGDMLVNLHLADSNRGALGDGSLDLENTRIMTGNNYVAGFVDGNSRLLFGASVHPYRKDAIDELDRVVACGACLIKWIPSAQNIVPDDSRCYAFYERMRYHGIPLLTHTGVEHTLPMYDNRLNDPERLIPALRQGVTVIAAHCGTRLYLHERCRFGQWANLAKEYPNFYGDLSAFGLPLHGGPLRRILRDSDLASKVLFGSDFPALTLPLWYIGRIGLRRAMVLTRIENPFDKALLTLKELGAPEQIFSRAERLLRLPPVSESSRVMKGTAH
ncbi:MAG TPA: amidohydrolase family protein, partial [Candidatus Sumerlaeota bacterium]|nr:amidohydrolase family protein [Candidatus Sumerlaeota bacterium]